MKRRIYALLLTAAMVSTVAGCGTRTKAIMENVVTTQAETSTAPQESETETTEEKDSEKKEESKESTQSKETKAEKADYDSATMMIYMVGSDLETQAAAASLDIAEMLETDMEEDGFRLLLCTGGSKMWWTEGIPSDACAVSEIRNGELNLLTELEGKNMSNPETLTEFLDYGQENYPSESYSLILWNHGGGSMVGYGADENYDFETMSTMEIGEALASSKICKDGNQLEWVGFDACLMGMVEVAHTLSPYARYMVASEEVESGYGWNYECLEDLSEKEYFDGRMAGMATVSAYEKFYKKQFKHVPDITLSCLDLQETDEVEQALDELVVVAKSELAQGGYSKIAKIRDGAKRFGAQTDSSMYDSVDLYDLADRMEEQYPRESGRLKEALNQFVVEHVTNTDKSHGVAIYFPYENKDYAEFWAEEYEKIGFSREYASFIKSFSDTLTGEALTQWDVAETDPLPKADGTGYYIQLSQDQVDNYSMGYASIWEDVDENGEYVCWYRSSDVTLQDEGTLESRFDGDYYSLVGADGNDSPCMMMEIERTDTYAKFAIPIIVFRDMDVFTVYAHVRMDAENPDGAIIGMYETMDAEESLLPSKQMFQLQEGDLINTFLFCRQIKFDEQGNVMPFETWDNPTMRGYELELTSGEIELTKKPFDTEGKYYCLFQIKDTQGNVHETNLVPISE